MNTVRQQAASHVVPVRPSHSMDPVQVRLSSSHDIWSKGIRAGTGAPLSSGGHAA
eukprot:COSAG01_NODE_39521_length_475_cov_1.446809_1_plen_54_part_01